MKRQIDTAEGPVFASGQKGAAVNGFAKKIKSRLNNTGGMSIGETLVAVMILLLATSVLVTTVGLGLRHYTRSLSASEANVLASTLESAMTNELACTSEIHVDGSGNVTAFQSQNYAVDAALSTFSVSGEGYGEVMISGLKLLGDGAYPNGLGVMIKQFTYDSVSCTFTIEISVGQNGSEILDRTFQVINVNETIPQSG